ncbi:hypothetical protein VZT92_017328 [Zoarces viviparus]|uniref:Matrin-type domain-containing protein n=1 Tax=Zoarces viviparus TaxID=48416 RepID=A0AAW1ERR2_ZOAVI
MSHPMYNPYTSGNPSSTQGQYGLSGGPAEKDPQRASSSAGPGSIFSFSGTSSGTSANSGGIIPSLLPQSIGYGLEPSRAIIDKNMERSIDMHIGRAREEVRLLGKPMQQPIDSHLTRIQRECLSSGTGMVSYPMSSASLGHRYPGVESGSRTSDWSSNYERPTADEPSTFYSTSASSSFARSADNVLISSSGREHAMQSLPNRQKYTSESASNILLRFGLEKEDLDHLVNYPEDQITPANLPYILRQIRIEKTKRAMTAVQSKPCSDPQAARRSHSGGAGMRQEEISSAVLEQSKVIDCGHSDKYTGGAGEEIGSASRSRENCGGSGSMLLIYTDGSSKHIDEPPQKTVESTALGFSRDQASSVSSFSSLSSSKLSSVAPPSNDQTKLQIQPKHSSQTILSSSLPKTDTDIRAVKSEASKPDALKEPETDRPSTTKTQPPCTLYCGVQPSRPDPVLIGSNDTSGNKDQNKSKAQGSIAGKINKQQPISQIQQKQKQQTEKQPVSQTGQAILPSVFSATELVPPALHIPSITGAMQHLPFIPVGPPPIVSPPALPQPIPDPVEIIDLTLSPSNKQPPAKVSVSKDLPTAAKMRDGAAATPRIFPHTCCLCNRECLQMKDWVYHQKTSFHLESCKVLRKRYPEWDVLQVKMQPLHRLHGIVRKPGPALVPAHVPAHPSPVGTIVQRTNRRNPADNHDRRTDQVAGPGQVLILPPPAIGPVRRALRNHRHRGGGTRKGPRQGGEMTDDQLQERAASSVSSLSSLSSSKLSSVAPPSNDQAKLQIQPKHSSQTILSSSLPKTDTDIRAVKSEASKPDALKEPETDRQSTTKTQPPCTLYCGVQPSRPDPVLIGSNDTSGNKDQNKSKAQGSIAGKINKQQPISQIQQKRKQRTEKQPVSQTGQAILPSVFSATESVPPALHIPSITGAMQHLPFIPVGSPPIVSPPALPQPIPDPVEIIDLTLSPSNKQPPAKVSVSKDLPTAAKMRDGAAATPRIFPHTCCLCNRECLQMKDWVYHQKTSFHLESCKVLRKRYPEWDGEIPSRTSAAGKDATSSQTSRHRQKTGSRSRSRSPIPRRHHRSGDKREKPSRQSRSPHRSSRRSRSGSRPTSSRHRSRSKSSEKQPSPRRRDEKRSSSRRRDDRRSTPRKSCKRQSSPRRTDEKRLPSFRSGKRRLPPRRTDERRSPQSRSDQGPSTRRESLRSTKSLAEKLLENSAVQLLSNKSDLDALVKSLAPIILAKLAKRKSPSSSPSSSSSSSYSSSSSPSSSNEGKTTLSSSASSSSSTAKKELTKKPSEAKPSLQKSEASSSTKTKCVKPSPPTMVKLQGIHSSVSRSDVLAALERFGKTKSFLLFPSKLEAIVCFEKEEDAEQLKSLKSLDVKGIQITVVGGKDTVCVEKKKPPLKEPSTSSVSTPLNTSTVTRKVLLPAADMIPLELPKTPPSSPSGPERDTTGELQNSAAEATEEENISAEQDNEMPQVFQTVTSVTPLTVGETIEKHLHRDRIKLFNKESVLWEKTIECFEKEEDAKKLKSLDVKGLQIPVVEAKKTVCVKQKKRPLKKRSMSSVIIRVNNNMSGVITPVNTSPIARKPSVSSVITPVNTSTRKVLLPTPGVIPHELPKRPPSSPSGAKRATAENEMPQVVHMFIHSPAEDARPMEIGAMGAEVVEPIEFGTLSEQKERRRIRTVGESIEKYLHQDRIQLFEKEEDVPSNSKLLLITNLPEYHDGCYTEEDLVKLLMTFGFKHLEDYIYVIPQTCMAFFRGTHGIRLRIMEATAKNGIFFKGSELAFHAVASSVLMTPIGFYKSLMQLMGFRVLDDGEKIVFIKGISPSDSGRLREVLKRIESVKNVLPLLDKVFVEFRSIRDADRLGVWYSLLKQAPDHKVHRLKIPSIDVQLPLPPKLPENALPDSEDVVAGATIPPIEIGVSQGSFGPFWIPMRTHPFLFPTGSPWFFSPDSLTVRGWDDVAKASRRDSRFPTIMLTGLPAGNYNHEEVAKLVWRYFPKRNLRSLYYNVVVLPLERRAFVFFANWTLCRNFVQDHIRNPVFVKFCPLTVHFVLEDISPVSSEEMMYTTLTWSNGGVPDPKLLEERLLCVETCETSPDIIGVVMEAVASVAPFVGFLPLANRICIEMADSSGVTQVVENQNKRRIFYRIKNIDIWSKVRCFEPLKSLKQRLQDSDEVTEDYLSRTTLNWRL